MQLVGSGLQNTPHFIAQCIGQYLTEVKGDGNPLIDHTEESTHYCVGQAYQRLAESRFAYSVHTDKINFFANGASKIYPVKFIESAKFLCKHYYYDSSQLEAKMEEREFADCFNDLLKKNTIYSVTG